MATKFIDYLLLSVALAASLTGVACQAATPDPSTAILRSVRLRQTVLDPMGNPIDHVGWNTKGEFKKITEERMVPVVSDGKSLTMLMFRPLLIPGTPWMQFRGGEHHLAAKEGTRLEKTGQEGWHPLKVAGQAEETLWMWKTVDTNGK